MMLIASPYRRGRTVLINSKTGVHMRRWLTWMVLLLAFAGCPRVASADSPSRLQGWGLPQLMGAMQSVRTATARFVERKFVHLLNQPLQSSGTLTFVAPDRLQKQTLAPAPSRLTVDGDRLEVEQPDGKLRNLSLSEVPEIGALVASIRATLAGDGATLTPLLHAHTDGQRWRLVAYAGAPGPSACAIC